MKYRRHLPYEGRQKESEVVPMAQVKLCHYKPLRQRYKTIVATSPTRGDKGQEKAMCSIDFIEVQLLLRKVQPFLRNKEDSEVALHASEVRQSRSEVTTLLSVKC